MNMIAVAILLFLLAAIAGLFVLSAILKNKTTSKPTAFIHGSIALIGLLILITYVAMGHTAPLLIASVVTFIIAALGGFTLFILDVTQKSVPKIGAIFHPLLAIAGLIMLVIYLFQTL